MQTMRVKKNEEEWEHFVGDEGTELPTETKRKGKEKKGTKGRRQRSEAVEKEGEDECFTKVKQQNKQKKRPSSTRGHRT